MKKFLIGILMYIIFLLLYFIQTNFFSWFTIAGVKPNIFIIYILFLGLYTDNKFAIIMSVILGLNQDLITGKTIGVTSIMYSIIAIGAGYFDKNFSKENKLSIIIMIITTTIIYETLTYFINALLIEYQIEMIPFIRILAIETVFNTILTYIFYKQILKLGTLSERQFKQKNILTRYF